MNNIYKFTCLLVFTLIANVVSADNISINSSKDSLYIYDDFSIEGTVLTNENGSTGFGWSDNWTLPTGYTIGLGDGYIHFTESGIGVIRHLLNPIQFAGSTFYVSFLFKKDSTGNFRISGHRDSDAVDRFGIHIKEDGRLGAQAGTAYANTVISNESFVENDKTYLAVAKYYYTTKPNMNISVFGADDVIPTDEPATWDLEAEGALTGMVAIDYFRLAFTSDIVNLDEFKLGDTWKSVSTTEITGSFPEPVEIEDANSDVQSVYQESTIDAKTWSYEITEPGDYQLGYSWIWVEGENDEVDLEVKRGTETIKTFTAKSAPAPYRFETRLEDISSGEQITVSATPKNGASYKLSYRLAFATPTFNDLPVFDVASYGGVGDGTTNDFQAVKDACAAAEDVGGGIITFDGSKTYYIEGPENYTVFDFLNTSGIKAEGNGAKLILHPKGNFIRMNNSENIHIDGFTTTYNPLPYFQGKITSINVSELYLDMQVDEKYDAPVTGVYSDNIDIFGRSFWNTIQGTKIGRGRHLDIDSTAKIGDDDHAIRVYLQSDETNDLQYSKSQGATDFIVPDRNYGHQTIYTQREPAYCYIHKSSRVKISNILTNSVCALGYAISSNFGPVTFTNTDILVPDPEDMHVSWRDGYHVWANRYGIMIEDGDFDAGYIYDDLFSPHTGVPKVSNVSGETIRLQANPEWHYQKYTDKPLWQVGDLVSFWDEYQMVYYGMARITEVTETGDPRNLDITLDSLVDQLQAGAYAINEEIINRDMVVRNCASTPSGRITTARQRTSILYQNCNFQNLHFDIYPAGLPWRIRPRNVVFDNCYINERLSFNVVDTWNINFRNCTINAGQVAFDNCPRIVMDSIYFTNIDSDAISLRSASHAYVFGDYAYNGDASSLEQKFNKDISSTINFTQPEVYPLYAPPFLVETGQSQDLIYADEPFDFNGTLLSNTGSGEGWNGAWTSTGTGITIDQDISLDYPEGIELNTSGGHIFERQGAASNERLLEYPVSLASKKFYMSFLAKKSAAGSFKIELNNSSNQSRFGIEVAANGTLTAKSGLGETDSNSGLFADETTYFVLVRYSNNNDNNEAVTRIKLYKNGDQLPEDDSVIDWDVESEPMQTGVDQDRLILSIEKGTVEQDEILIGNSYQSVTSDENYIPVKMDYKYSNTTGQLIVQNLPEKVRVILPEQDGRILIYDSTGRQLYSDVVRDNFWFIPDHMFNSGLEMMIIHYQTANKYYSAKYMK